MNYTRKIIFNQQNQQLINKYISTTRDLLTNKISIPNLKSQAQYLIDNPKKLAYISTGMIVGGYVMTKCGKIVSYTGCAGVIVSTVISVINYKP